ncbi:MAG: UbiA family prenyltransferase [Pseudomonadota bacterium]
MRDLLREIRPHQWSKNVLVFVPLLAAHRVFDREAFVAAFLAFVAFGLFASAGYVWNDLFDLENDRRHPTKKNRPLASGRISKGTAWGMIAVLLSVGLIMSWRLPSAFRLILFVYLFGTTLYSAYLKKLALLDVLVLAALYTVRIFAGSTAVGVPISEWLLAFSMFFFLSLALAKRFTELKLLEGRGEMPGGRGYISADLDYVPIMGIASGFMTSMVMALYVSGEHVRSLYRRPEWLWLICPIILYWIGRIWLYCHRDRMHDDPVVFALRDRGSYLVLALVLVIMAFAT